MPLASLIARRHDRAPAAEAPRAHVLDDAGDRNLLVAPELRDRDLVDRELVAARPVLQEVEHGLDAERAQALRERGPDAGQRLDRRARRRVAGPPSRAVAATRAGPRL